MLSELYLKTKNEISNIKNINFSEEQWEWYYDDAVKKRLKDLDISEGFVIETYVHASRAKALLRETQKQYLECV